MTGGALAVGIVGQTGFCCAILISGIRAKGHKKLRKHLQGHMVTGQGEPVDVSR
jgi:hypothetical protein